MEALLNLVRTVAPSIATAVGGPLAGMAMREISEALLGRPDATEDELVEAAKSATPDQLLALKQAEQSFVVRMRELDVDLERISNEDRSSAREREAKTGDHTPKYLAGAVTLGFFGVLSWMIAYGLPDNGGEAMLVMLGTLGTAWGAIVSYYFGSSAGSREKNEVINKAIRGNR